MDTVAAWMHRLKKDAGSVKDRLEGTPVLVYSPPVEEEQTIPMEVDADEYRLRTQSGLFLLSPGNADEVAILVAKSKENAFKRRITVGRTTNNDVVLDDASVSRFHAWIEHDGHDRWTLTDAGSRNGTAVAGRKLQVRTPASLTNRVKVRVGSLDLVFFTPDGFVDYLVGFGR